MRARDPSLPTRLGRYEVRAKIGEGGMASVYVGRLTGPPGHEDHFARVVALKVIKEELCRHPEFVAMFLDEAKIISRLSHPNCVQVIELGNEGDRLFLAMELLLGQSLWEVWDACRARGVRLRYDLAAWIGARAADGLHHAHEVKGADGQPQMLVHRDVNASNVLVTYDGQVKVIDFGLAKARGRSYKTAGGVVKGKLAYLSPEQVAGHPVDRRADVFALGTTLWEIVVDRRLFKSTTDADTLKRVYAAEVPDPTQLVDGFPPGLWAVLRRALSRDPEQRYATAAELGRALDDFARSEGRAVDARELARVMGELFAAEAARDARWIADASAPDRPAPGETMHPASVRSYPPPPDVTEEAPPAALPVSVSWVRGAPPDDMFAPPASRRPPPSAPPRTSSPPPPLRAPGAGASAVPPPAPPARIAVSSRAKMGLALTVAIVTLLLGLFAVLRLR